MRVRSCFEMLSSLLLAAILFVTSGSAELPASSQVWCLLTCDNCHVCGCLCAFPTTCVWNRKRERARHWIPKCEWQLGAQRAQCQSNLCVAKCVGTFVCVRARCGDRRSPQRSTECPSQHSLRWILCGPPAGPIIWHMSAPMPNAHISQCSQRPITRPQTPGLQWTCRKHMVQVWQGCTYSSPEVENWVRSLKYLSALY